MLKEIDVKASGSSCISIPECSPTYIPTRLNKVRNYRYAKQQLSQIEFIIFYTFVQHYFIGV